MGKETLEITKDAAVDLLAALGLRSAVKWPIDCLQERLSELDEMIDEEIRDGLESKEIRATADAVLSAIADDIQIVIVESTDPPEPADDVEAEIDAADDSEKEDTGSDDDSEEAFVDDLVLHDPPIDPVGDPDEGGPEHPKKKKAKKHKKEKPAKVEKKETKEKNQQPKRKRKLIGVRASRSGPYLAGVLFKHHGLENGVSPEILQDLAYLRGRVNEREDFQLMQRAWHTARGLSEGDYATEMDTVRLSIAAEESQESDD